LYKEIGPEAKKGGSQGHQNEGVNAKIAINSFWV